MKRLYQRLIIASVLMMLVMPAAFAQQHSVTGVVKDKSGATIPGVNVLIKGSSDGTVTDANGTFSLSAAEDDILVVTFIGYKTSETRVGTQTSVSIVLEEDVTNLQEVVIVGYGTQKKVLNTGANFQVSGDDIQKQSQTNVLQGLQGQTPGVQITSTSGQPGSGIKVIIRGLGTIGNGGPLYVVDGVLTGDISYLNNADIQSVDVLKDAASAAIYGSQGANGVVLITTRSGKRGAAPKITFDSYYGVQNVARKIDLLNATEYATLQNEAAVNSGNLPIYTNEQIAALGKGTNWLDKMFVKNAPTKNYSFGMSGGSDYSTYSASISYTGQAGIVGGQTLSNYERYNFRFNSEHKLYKEVVTIGENLSFAYMKNNGVGVGNQYNNTLRGAFNTTPMLVDSPTDTVGMFNQANPYNQMVVSNQNRNNNQKLLGNLYMIVEPIKGLKFRTSLGLDYYVGESRSYNPVYKLSVYAFNQISDVSQSMSKGNTILWDNTVSYGMTLASRHRVDLLAGSSAYMNSGTGLYGSNSDLSIQGLGYAYLGNATNTNSALISLGGLPSDADKRMSYFGRLNYNFNETYLLNATYRVDGSSKFARGHRWGYFPSVSAGWVLSNEDFMESTKGFLDFLKIRASWGKTGNLNVPAFRYQVPIQFTTTNYTFGPTEGVRTPGAFQPNLANPNLHWENSEQSNIGFDARFFAGKVNASMDYYVKNTNDWLVQAPILAIAGAGAPYINAGNVRNTGIELALSYSDNIGDFNYRVGVNGAHIKNRVTSLPTSDGIVHGDPAQLYDNSGEFYRAQQGFPIGYFWGLQTNGLFQNEAAVANNKSKDGTVIQPGAHPGDVRYVDRNGDGIISDADRTNIGNPNPTFTFGFNVSANYKGFDLLVQANGVTGNKLVQSYRNQASQFSNYTKEILGRWHGEGTSNSIPRVTQNNSNYSNFSDLFIKNGDFLRISNITLGYDVSKLVKLGYLSQFRVYASVLNAFTFTKYNGMDPEIGYGQQSFSSGVDVGYYPRPRTFMLGVNVKF